jgi:hypothetical protein
VYEFDKEAQSEHSESINPTLREEHRLSVFKNMVPRRTFAYRRYDSRRLVKIAQ